MTLSLDRTIEIRARPATVFRFFTDSARWARWWGAGSTIDARVGGAILIVYPNGARASGVVREIEPDERIAFTFGYETGTPIAPGGSLVTITLAPIAGGTRLELRHDVDSIAARDEHVRGWRYQLARFAHVVADEAFDAAVAHCAAWIAAWNDDDPRAGLEAIAAPDVRFRDAYGDVYGLAELVEYVAALRRFVPGVRLEARGTPRRAHDTAVADWAIVAADGTVQQIGTNVIRFGIDGRIADVVGCA